MRALHLRQYEKRRDLTRGSAAERGYGAEHRELRTSVARVVEAGEAVRFRCGQPIEHGGPWDFGHDDDDRTL